MFGVRYQAGDVAIEEAKIDVVSSSASVTS